ncbi:helix-turn-helix domain-containing protein [Massilia sp. W12]|uniref:helix-turn-helix transcriptional regulator n=1 Tax=Massilia sp. W12 TaxID=3126507 RepID=UPI0030D513C3
MKRAAPARLLLWPGMALVIGSSVDSRMHAHFALQLSLAAQPFALQCGDGPSLPCSAACIAPNQAHQLWNQGQSLLHVFAVLPPGMRLQSGQHGAQPAYAQAPGFAALRLALLDLLTPHADLSQAGALARAWLDLVLQPAPAPGMRARLHAQRLEAVRTLIAADLQSRQAAQGLGARLAGAIHMSESRFHHWFSAQMGLPLSRYVLWQRLEAAAQAIAGGASITAAAHHAGFADAAHMSRSFHATIGIAPSHLQKMTITFKPEAPPAA